MLKEKLIKIGIKDEKELQSIIKSGPRLAFEIWKGNRPLSVKSARIIKAKFGIPLDYLLD